MSPARLGITWQLSDSHGWGVFGLNFALQLIKRGNPTPLLFRAPTFIDTLPDTVAPLKPFVNEQIQIENQVLKPAGNSVVNVADLTILHALGNKFKKQNNINGGINIGFIFFERGGIDDKVIERTKAYDKILAGSSWNRDYARQHGITNIEFVSQGIDPELFFRGPASEVYREKFTIFSGGKLEIRKGQDLVLAAFKVFHKRHPEAILITAWQNAWPESALGMSTSMHIEAEPEVDPLGQLKITDWVVSNGVPKHAFVDLGWTANRKTATILRNMNVGVFPNRCEGGTNLVAMEAMACGVPCILSANTGHLDIIEGDNCIPLVDQAPISETGNETEMWRESKVDEIVAALEMVYANQEEAKRRGALGAESMKRLSWSRQTDRLLNQIDGLI
ncbi:MAG: glycosyltransferase [Magnetovibrio sp.]|nr:glycosyltransferase [Magnetovibrio sp.]